jgi:hypothetical protein
MNKRHSLIWGMLLLAIAIAILIRKFSNLNHERSQTSQSTSTFDVTSKTKEPNQWKEFSTAWEALFSKNTGPSLVREQQQLLEKALDWGFCGDTNLLIDFLSAKEWGGFSMEFVTKFAERYFPKGITQEQASWITRVRSEGARDQLLEHSGKFCRDDVHLDELLSFFKDEPKYQAKVVTGYAIAEVKKNPLRAMEIILEKTPKNTEFTGLIPLMWNLPDDCDYSALSAALPPDEKFLAKQSRKIIFHKWASIHPQDAAEYILDHVTMIHVDQLGIVIDQWCRQSPELAEIWLNAKPPGDHKDEALLVLQRFWLSKQPAKAFLMTTSIKNKAKREASATDVFQEWVKSDSKAAEAAWGKAFPR